MIPFRRWNGWRFAAAALLLTCGSLAALGDDRPAQAAQSKADLSKRRAEAPARRVVTGSASAQNDAPVPTPKPTIENPTKALVRSGASPAAAGDFVNPKVTPGRVSWHADVATACAAAKRSGKSVLLFLMMGKLDDQFC